MNCDEFNDNTKGCVVTKVTDCGAAYSDNDKNNNQNIIKLEDQSYEAEKWKNLKIRVLGFYFSVEVTSSV